MNPSPSFAAPVVATYGNDDPAAPLVVLLHGRGSSESEIIGLAPHLPQGPAYAAVRAPIAEGGGYAWFANHGIGRPVAGSLARTMAWFRAWLDDVAPAGRPVVVVGFSGGGAFAGGLVLNDPARYAGAAVLFATLPFEAGVATDRGRLAHLPVFVAQGDQDHVIPADLLGRTWRYLLEESGAPVVARRTPGGHALTERVVADLGGWIAERVDYLTSHVTPVPGDHPAVTWPTLPGGVLPTRTGPAPEVTWSIPQQQVTQNAPVALQERLLEAVGRLPGVEIGPSHISVPGARALTVSPTTASRDPHAFLVPSAREFAHLHPAVDGSLHLALPAAHAANLVDRGWGRTHPLAGTRLSPGFVLLYGPRDEAELAVVVAVVAASRAQATRDGTFGTPSTDPSAPTGAHPERRTA